MASTDELMQSIETSIGYMFKLRGISEDDLKTTVDYVRLKICQAHQGEQIRIKTPDAIHKKKRNEGIKKTFKGNNMQQTCERFGVTPRTVYRVIKKT